MKLKRIGKQIVYADSEPPMVVATCEGVWPSTIDAIVLNNNIGEQMLSCIRSAKANPSMGSFTDCMAELDALHSEHIARTFLCNIKEVE